MSSYKDFIGLVPEPFGKVYEVVYAHLQKLEPEKVAQIFDPDNMPDDFVPYIAWQLGVLYETVMNGLDPHKMIELRELKKLEGTAKGVKEALALIPDSSFEYEKTGPCLFKVVFKPDSDVVFSQKSWDYLYYLVNDYKRKSAHCQMYIGRKKDVTEYIAGGLRLDRTIKFPLQIVTPPSPSTFYLLDPDGNILTDADGNKLFYNPVEVSSFLLDPDGNILTDNLGNKLFY